MPCILSTLGIVEIGFCPLSIIDIDFFRETFVFTYFFLCESSGLMRDQSSQFVPNSGLHVAGEKKICFQTIIFEGVNFIVNTRFFIQILDSTILSMWINILLLNMVETAWLPIIDVYH